MEKMSLFVVNDDHVLSGMGLSKNFKDEEIVDYVQSSFAIGILRTTLNFKHKYTAELEEGSSFSPMCFSEEIELKVSEDCEKMKDILIGIARTLREYEIADRCVVTKYLDNLNVVGIVLELNEEKRVAVEIRFRCYTDLEFGYEFSFYLK